MASAQGSEWPQTLWSRIAAAGEGDRKIAGEVFERYRGPLLRLIQRNWSVRQDVEDLYQGLVARLLEKDLLAKADCERGKFRAWVITVTRHYLDEERRRRGAEKRGGGALHVSLDAPVGAGGSTRLGDVISDGEDLDLAKDLLLEDVQFAMAQLRDQCSREEKPYYRVLDRYSSLAREDAPEPYEVMVGEFGGNVVGLRKTVSRARAMLGDLVKERVRARSSSREEYEEEIARLSRMMNRSAER